MRNPITVATALGAMVLVAGTVISADTIVLGNGRRVTGTLVAIQDGIIQFREGGNRRQMLRLDRDEVSRIELDDPDRQHGGTGDTLPRPRGMREREVIVSADVPWVDTAIDVRAGQTVYFEAIGHVWWGRNRKDGPAGERDSPYNPGRPMPRRPAAALIGKVGQESADPFFIGDDRGPVRARTDGRLFLGINDDFLTDNHGNFRVVVYY
jgi:hypothetical protein